MYKYFSNFNQINIMRNSIFLLTIFIASFACAQTLQPNEKEVLINVLVTDFKAVVRKGETIIFASSKTKKTFSGTTDDKGKFSILLSKGDTYFVKYKEFIEEADYSSLEVPDKAGLYITNLTIKIETPKTITLQNVFFDVGKATLKPESYKALNDLVEVMKAKTSLIIEIAGHTDNTGTPESNLKLSLDRANAVRDYLIKNSISPNRVQAKGYGDTEPVADNDTEQGKQQNRRTEVRIIKE